MPLFGKPKPPALASRQREEEIERFAKEALLLEARLNRPITKNDLFLSLHIPFDLLDPVTRSISKEVRVDLKLLGSSERDRLERESHDVIVRGLAERAEVIEKRGLTMADVAALCPAGRSLADLQRLFGYMRAVLELKELPPRTLMPSEVSRLLPRAAALPPEERTPFRLVRNLGVGLYTARLVKAAMG
ncbi:MAG: hypothetical protein KGI98_17465 [Euryarchaeota archaeon]|nr:hypothetical protein [Euryarchaeota archaeon]